MDPASPPTRTPRALIAPASPLANAARLALAIGVAAMKQHETAAIAGEIEPLHQMRVSARRLRATVQLFAGVIHGSRVNIYQRDLPWLGRAAGAVRDCDVIEALIRDCGKHLDPTLATALTPLAAVIAASRDAEHARFVEDLRSPTLRAHVRRGSPIRCCAGRCRQPTPAAMRPRCSRRSREASARPESGSPAMRRPSYFIACGCALSGCAMPSRCWSKWAASARARP